MYKGTLIAVKNMEESKKFYHDILGMNVEGDFGANVQLEGGLFLQTLDTWSYFINGKELNLKNNAGELYFEVSDIDGFHKKLQTWESRIGRAGWICREFERKAVAMIELSKFKKY